MPVEKAQFLGDTEFRNSLNILFHSSSRLSQVIYICILCLLLFAGAGMAIFKIPVYVKSRGIIRPSASVIYILAPVPGIIKEINVGENQYIKEGERILQFDTDKEKMQNTILEKELQEIHNRISDLQQILDPAIKYKRLISGKYRVENRIYTLQLKNMDLRLNLAETDRKRFESLAREEFISQKEFEKSLLDYRSIVTEKEQLISGNEKQWNNDLSDLITREGILLKQLGETGFYIQKSGIDSPVSGTIQGIRNRYPGEYCSAGTNVCRLVPDTNLVAELFLPPGEIGLIKPGQFVRLLIDAYDFKYWGVINATCQSISEDIEIIENQAFFRVVCGISSDQKLEYHGKYVNPGKGMTLTAQFLVTEKNIWQLLHDRLFILISELPEK